MKKITILVGPKASGKTTRANEMAVGKKSVTITNPDLRNPYCFKDVQTDTELIILEEIVDIIQINELMNRQQLSVNGPLIYPFHMPIPQIIIITQKPVEHLFDTNENVDIIHCVHFDPWPVVLDEYKELSKSDVQNLKASVK